MQSLGIGVETALEFLYFQRPGQDAFKQWLAENRRDSAEVNDIADEDVLSEDDLAFWNENGYLVLENAIPEKQCADACDAIWEFLRANPDDQSSWYQEHEGKRGLMVSFFDHPALEANRNSMRIRNAYRQLYGSRVIYKTIDKVSFNPPEHAGFRFVGSALHWDTSLVLPIPFCLQGLLYLSDCANNDGAFHCVPGFHHRIGEWLQSLPLNADPRELAPRTLRSKAVTGKAGDFVIWHQALPHCATPNHGKLPRLVQYLTYLPEEEDESKEWR